MKLRSGSESNGSGPGARKKSERCIAKEAPFLIDAPLSVGSRTDQRVIAKEASSKATKRCIAKEAPFLIDVPFGQGGKTDRRVHR